MNVSVSSPMLRYGLYALGVVIIIVLVGIILWNFDPFHRRQHAETKAATATVAATVAQGQTEIVDHYHHDVTVIHDKTEQETNAVRKLPDANTPLSPERHAALCGSLSRLWNSATDVCAAGDQPEPAGTVR